MGRFVAILFAVLLLIAAVILFFIGQVAAGVTAVIGCGFLMILLDFLEKWIDKERFKRRYQKPLPPLNAPKR